MCLSYIFLLVSLDFDVFVVEDLYIKLYDYVRFLFHYVLPTY